MCVFYNVLNKEVFIENQIELLLRNASLIPYKPLQVLQVKRAYHKNTDLSTPKTQKVTQKPPKASRDIHISYKKLVEIYTYLIRS